MRRILAAVWEYIRYTPGLILDYCMEHMWAEILLTIVVSILTSLLTIFSIALLAAAGCIPSPWWSAALQ